jgi:hypothetical protein
VQPGFEGRKLVFHVTTRWGADESAATVARMREVLAQLDVEDAEHQSVSLTHESEWCLGAYPGGLLVWENLESGEPRHMNGISRERVLELWLKLSEGRVAEIDAEPWSPGYEDGV